jgi:putative ABC transport system permease protein
MIRLALATYSLLLKGMPKRFRQMFGAESLADLVEILEEAQRFQGQSVIGTALRAHSDLLLRIPGEWWATVKPVPLLGGHGVDSGRLGMGERLMNVLREIQQAARALVKRPGFSIISVLTLALGIGANVAIYSIVNAVLLRPLPYEDSEQIVELRHHAPGLNLPELMNSEGTIAFYRERANYFETIAAYGRGSANLTGADEPARIELAPISPELFQVLRVQPMMGRPFGEADAGPESPPVAILSFGTWQSRFGSDPSVLGRTLELDGVSTEVVGVMPDGFNFPDEDAEIFTAMYVNPEGPFGTFGIQTVARLSAGISVDAAQTRSTELLGRVPEFFPELGGPEFLNASGFAVSVESLRDRLVADVESTLWIILGTVAFVLLIACANVANLFLVRAESRQKEMAVRAAMGAGRRSMATSFLSESLLLGAGGGLMGVALARGGVSALLSVANLPRSAEVSVDAAALTVAALLSVVAGLVFGAIPMTRYMGRRFGPALHDGSRGSTVGKKRHRARNLLVASQLALGLILLVGSGLMLRSFSELRAVDLGIEPEGVLTMGLNRNEGEDPEIAARFYQQAADQVAALPGVAMVGITTNVPLSSGNSNGGSFRIESKPRGEDELPPVAMYRAVGPSYFASMGIPIVEGRDMSRADAEEVRPVVWVNEDFARTFLDGNWVGERVRWSGDTDSIWAEVVGVVGDVREFGLKDDELRPNAYFPLRVEGPANIQIASAFLTIKAAEGQDPTGLVAGAQAAIRQVDGQVPITATRSMDDIVSEAMESTSITMVILSIATAMALFLGAIGLAGVISYVVGQRTREIGVRVALGAKSSDVRSMIFRQSLVVIVGGTALGLIGALGLTRLMDALLFEVSATDPVTFITAPIVMIAISLLATWIPVRKAMRVSPTEALAAE